MKYCYPFIATLALLVAFTACKKDKATAEETGCPKGAVDLGIVMTRGDGTTYNLYWAKSNLCEDGLCANPEDYGDYYAWGETDPYYKKGHGQDNPCLDWRDGKSGGYVGESYIWYDSSYKLKKYCTNSSAGIVDNLTELQRAENAGETMDDAARAVLGGKWRMPTDAEWEELMKCTWDWTVQNGVSGRLVTGPNGNSIFLPAAGSRTGTDLEQTKEYGYYRSSTVNTNDPIFAWCVIFSSETVDRSDGTFHRTLGESIRPVTE